MGEIRPLTHDDLPGAARLLRANLDGWSGDEHFLAAQTIDHPWAEDDCPSLVAVDEDGAVVGLMGAQVRRLRFEGEPIRGVCCTQLAVDASKRNTPLGAFLVKRMLSGPQALTWSDHAAPAVLRIWAAFGGYRDASRSCDWMLVLHPLQWVRSVAGALARRKPVGRNLVPVAGLPFQTLHPRLVSGLHPRLPEGTHGEDADSATIVESMTQIGAGLKLWVEHDQAHLDHMLGELQRFYGRPVATRLVRMGGRPIGWYAYLRPRGHVAHVLHLTASNGHAGAVLSELVEHLRGAGTAVVAGRSEPHLAEALTDHYAVLGFARRPVLHVSDPKLEAALQRDTAILTRLDGEPFSV